MSISTQIQSPAVPTEIIWRLRVDDYHEMIQAGILTDDDPVELLEGWLVTKMPKNAPHRIATGNTRKALEKLVTEGDWYVDSQEPITTADSEPEPDVVVVRGKTADYPDRHPGPEDVALIVEVADSTLQRDRTIKKRIYARAGIRVYWIINLIDRLIEVYSDPDNKGEYRERRDYGTGDSIPFLIEGRIVGQISVDQLLP